jgi:hypothetical protein
VPTPENLDGLTPAELKALLLELLGRVRDLERQLAMRDAEIARLKGLKGRPDIRPSGMEPGDKTPSGPSSGPRRGGGNKTARRTIHEDRVIQAAVPAGSRFKGYQSFVVQDLVLRAHVLRLRRERWLTPAGQRITAPLPAGMVGHFGPELRRFVLAQYHQGQVTVARLVAQLRAIGIDISQRQVMRLLIAGQDGFLAEARDVLRAGLETAPWISVDDTGARHAGANGICTQIGNQDFTWFGSSRSKSRLNFLGLLRAGHADYVINDVALTYLRERGLAAPLIARLADDAVRHFADSAAWTAQLDRLGIHGLEGSLGPARIATEGALWGSIAAHGFLRQAVRGSAPDPQRRCRPVRCRPPCALLGPCRAAGASPRHLHRRAVRGAAASPRADLVVLRRPQGVSRRPVGPTTQRVAHPLRSHLPPQHGVRDARPAAGPAAGAQARPAAGARPAGDPAPHQWLGE